MEIFSYFDPRTNHNTLEHFSKLSWKSVAVTLFATAVATVVTFPLLGIGGFAAIRFMAEWLDQPEPDSIPVRIDQAAQQVFGQKPETLDASSLFAKSIEETLQTIQVDKNDPNRSSRFADQCAQNFYKNFAAGLEKIPIDERVVIFLTIFDHKTLLGCLGRFVEEKRGQSLEGAPQKDEKSPLIKLDAEEISSLKEKLLGEPRKLFLINQSSHFSLGNLELILDILRNEKYYPEEEFSEVVSIIVHKYYQRCVKEIFHVLDRPKISLSQVLVRLENSISFFERQKILITEDGFNAITKYKLSVPDLDEAESDVSDQVTALDKDEAIRQHELAMNSLKKAAVLYRINSSLSQKMDFSQFTETLSNINDLIEGIDKKSFVYNGVTILLRRLAIKLLSDQQQYDQEQLQGIKALYEAVAERMDAIFEKKEFSLLKTSGVITLKGREKIGEFQKSSMLIGISTFDLKNFDLNMFQRMLKEMKEVLVDADQGSFIYVLAKLALQNITLKLQNSKVLNRNPSFLKPLYDELATKLHEALFVPLRPDGRRWDDPNAEADFVREVQNLTEMGFTQAEIDTIVIGEPDEKRGVLTRRLDAAGVKYWMNKYKGD